VKWTGPDGVVLDVSKTGWLGKPTFGRSPRARDDVNAIR
jgi:hypothetical protein